MTRSPWLIALLVLSGCGPVIVDHSPGSNLLDPDSASLEGSIGQWSAWFSTRISREASAAKVGELGLQIEVTEPYGWGVQTDNWPGFEASPGVHRASFWARTPRGGQTAIMELSWRDENGEELQIDQLTSAVLNADWAKTSAEITAPPRTTRLGVRVTGDEGDPGELIQLDAFVVQPPVSP